MGAPHGVLTSLKQLALSVNDKGRLHIDETKKVTKKVVVCYSTVNRTTKDIL